jgi:hypothetical protein
MKRWIYFANGHFMLFEFCDYQDGKDVSADILGFKNVWTCGYMPTFQSNIPLPMSELKAEAVHSTETSVFI